MSSAYTEKKMSQKQILQNDFSFSKKSQEKSNEDTETENTDSNQSFDSFSIIQLISSTLDDVIIQNENSKNNPFDYDDSLFAHKKIPKIDIEDYLERIQKYTKMEDSTLTIALIYIERLLNKQNIKLSKYNVHRILLTSISLAIKYNEDEIYANNFYAKVFGISSKELNKLENEFLDLIEFKLFISDETFKLYYDKI